MAETAGLALAIVPLVVTLKSFVSTARQVKHAVDHSERLQEIVARALVLSELCQALSDNLKSIDQVLPGDILELVYSAIESANTDLHRIANRLKKLAAGSKKLIRWKAIVGSHEEAQTLKSSLSQTETALNTVLHICGLRTQVFTLRLMETFNSDLKMMALGERSQGSAPILSRNQDAIQLNPILSQPSGREASAPDVFYRWDWSYRNKELAGSYGLITTQRKHRHHTYRASSAFIKLPSCHMIAVHLLWRRLSNAWLRFSLLNGSSVSVVNIVSECSPVMHACQIGDVVTLRSLLSTGQARPDDVTPDNTSVLCIAIEGGNLEAVQTLIDFGADVDGLFGSNQTSPLAWALCWRKLQIARLLLSHGASLDHVSAFGWSPLFYLWTRAAEVGNSAADFITVLASQWGFQFLHEGIADMTGFGAVHRAVIFGTADEVALLLRLGVSPFQQVGPLSWTTIQYAVFYKRLEAFEELLPYYQKAGIGIDVSDVRGWTLLRIDAEAGFAPVTRRLLELGASPHAMSIPSFTHMPESLHGRSFPPTEVAKAECEDAWLEFLAGLEDYNGIKALPSVEAQIIGLEKWYDAATDFESAT